MGVFMGVFMRDKVSTKEILEMPRKRCKPGTYLKIVGKA